MGHQLFWLVVKNQVKTDAGKYIDILYMDHDGDMVVVELKKDLTPREVTAQVIDYATSVSKMSTQDIVQLYLDFLCGNETLIRPRISGQIKVWPKRKSRDAEGRRIRSRSNSAGVR